MMWRGEDGLPRGHPQFRDLRSQFDPCTAVVDQASGDRHRVGDDEVGEVRIAVEGAVADGRQSLGQDDTAQGRVARECGISDSGRSLGNRHVCVRLRGQVQDQGAASVALAVEDTVFHGVHRVGGVHGQRGEVVRAHERGFADGGNARAQVDRGQGGVGGEGTLTDRGHRVGECGGGERRGVEGEVADLGQAIQVGTEIHLGEGLVVAEGTIRQHRGTTQVNALQLGHVPESRVVHGLEGVRQGQGRNPRPHERTLANVTQMRGQGHGGDLRRGESTLVDECGLLSDGVGAARVLRLRVCRQVRQILRVQDAVEALVVLVRGVDLDALQERGACECREQAVGLDVRADVDGAQLAMSLKVSRPAVLRERGRETLSRGVYEKARSPIVSSCEGCASSSWKVTWVSGWPAKAESSMARTLAGIHTLVSCAPGEGIRADLGHALGDANVRRPSRVGDEHAVGVDGELIIIGLRRGGCVHLTTRARVGRESGGHADRGQRQGTGERERQHH